MVIDWPVSHLELGNYQRQSILFEFDHTSGAKNNRILLETIEKGNLGEKGKSKKCSRKVADDVKEDSRNEMLVSKGPAGPCLATDEQKENKVPTPVEVSTSVSSILLFKITSCSSTCDC